MNDKSWASFKGPHKLESVGDNKKPGTEEWSIYQTALQKKNTKDMLKYQGYCQFFNIITGGKRCTQ